MNGLRFPIPAGSEDDHFFFFFFFLCCAALTAGEVLDRFITPQGMAFLTLCLLFLTSVFVAVLCCAMFLSLHCAFWWICLVNISQQNLDAFSFIVELRSQVVNHCTLFCFFSLSLSVEWERGKEKKSAVLNLKVHHPTTSAGAARLMYTESIHLWPVYPAQGEWGAGCIWCYLLAMQAQRHPDAYKVPRESRPCTLVVIFKHECYGIMIGSG